MFVALPGPVDQRQQDCWPSWRLSRLALDKYQKSQEWQTRLRLIRARKQSAYAYLSVNPIRRPVSNGHAFPRSLHR